MFCSFGQFVQKQYLIYFIYTYSPYCVSYKMCECIDYDIELQTRSGLNSIVCAWQCLQMKGRNLLTLALVYYRTTQCVPSNLSLVCFIVSFCLYLSFGRLVIPILLLFFHHGFSDIRIV